MTELATQHANQDSRDVQSEFEQLTDELQREQQELKRIKTITRQVHVLCPLPSPTPSPLNYLHIGVCCIHVLTVTVKVNVCPWLYM